MCPLRFHFWLNINPEKSLDVVDTKIRGYREKDEIFLILLHCLLMARVYTFMILNQPLNTKYESGRS